MPTSPQHGSRLLGCALCPCTLLGSVMVWSTSVRRGDRPRTPEEKWRALSWAPCSLRFPTLPLAQTSSQILAVELRLEKEGEDRECKSSVPREALCQPWKRKAPLGAVIVWSHLQEVWDRRHERPEIKVDNWTCYDRLQVWLFLVGPFALNYFSNASKNYCLMYSVKCFLVLIRKGWKGLAPLNQNPLCGFANNKSTPLPHFSSREFLNYGPSLTF